MADKDKKPKTVDEIVSDYQKYHHKLGKKFSERIKKFEEFQDPDSIHNQQFAHHAHYMVFGKPSDLKSFPGAYNEAYKVLDSTLKEDDDKLEDEDKLATILEKYADTFLDKAMGKRFKETMEHAEKEEKLSKKDLRELKGQLLSRYYSADGKNPTNILSEGFIKNLKGKKKVELIDHLQKIGETTKQHYHMHLASSALDGLLSEEDHLDMTKYITPIFKERGWKHKYSHLTRTIDQQAEHYGALLSGDSKTLTEKGYKPIKYEKKEEKK